MSKLKLGLGNFEELFSGSTQKATVIVCVVCNLSVVCRGRIIGFLPFAYGEIKLHKHSIVYRTGTN